MKWVFLLAVIFGTPALASFLRSSPRYLVPTCFVTGLLMFVIGPTLWTAAIPITGWQGPVQGLEISFLDGISLALIIATRRVSIPWPVKLAFGVICVALIISTAVSFQPKPAIFYAFQLFRAVLLFWAVARVCGTVPGAPVALIAGLGIGLIYEAVLASYQYATGALRPGGNLGHSNFLGASVEFVVFPALALMLGTRRSFWPAAVVLAGLIIAIVGGSRATLGLVGVGCLLTIIFSIRRRSSSRKMAMGAVAMLALLAATPLMISSAQRRTEAATESSNEERTAMKLAARMMIADHPFGVGANQYVLVANIAGYSQRAGVSWTTGSRSAPVHNTYYLVTAELGFIGLIGFVSMLAAFIAYGFSRLRGYSEDDSAELMPGLLAAMIATSVHLAYEWVFMHFMLHYLIAAGAGMLVGVGALMSKSTARSATVPAAFGVPSHAS